jgi:hypothetical protein
MRQMTGKQSISFAKAVYIEGSAAIVGEKEKDGPLGEYFSHTLSDPMCGQESWEEGESELQLATAKLAMQKANVRPEQIGRSSGTVNRIIVRPGGSELPALRPVRCLLDDGRGAFAWRDGSRRRIR